jgi:hypothetical protein
VVGSGPYYFRFRRATEPAPGGRNLPDKRKSCQLAVNLYANLAVGCYQSNEILLMLCYCVL